jgi:hypothetical protein
MLSILNRNKEARENAIKVIIEEMALEQFGIEEVRQKMKSLLPTCGGGQNKIQDLQAHYRFCTTTSRRLGYMPVCKQHLHGKLLPVGGRQATCPPDLVLYLPHANAAQRMEFCQWLLQQLAVDPGFPCVMLFMNKNRSHWGRNY